MALEFGFYNSYDGDRRYNAEQMSGIFEGLITDGVYASVGEKFGVFPGVGLQVLVGTGRAYFKETWNKNKARVPLDLEQPDPVFDRIDAVCLRVRKAVPYRENDLMIYKGTIMVNPEPPIFATEEDVYYLPLAYVTVKAGSTSVSAADIQILVGSSNCPFVTSILQQTDIDILFAQWNAQFMEWWAGIREVLDGDTVGNIMNLIDKKVNISDVATDSDILTGTDNTKWVSAKGLKTYVDVRTKLDEIYEVGDIIDSYRSIGSSTIKWLYGGVRVTSYPKLSALPNIWAQPKSPVTSEYAQTLCSFSTLNANMYMMYMENGNGVYLSERYTSSNVYYLYAYLVKNHSASMSKTVITGVTNSDSPTSVSKMVYKTDSHYLIFVNAAAVDTSTTRFSVGVYRYDLNLNFIDKIILPSSSNAGSSTRFRCIAYERGILLLCYGAENEIQIVRTSDDFEHYVSIYNSSGSNEYPLNNVVGDSVGSSNYLSKAIQKNESDGFYYFLLRNSNLNCSLCKLSSDMLSYSVVATFSSSSSNPTPDNRMYSINAWVIANNSIYLFGQYKSSTGSTCGKIMKCNLTGSMIWYYTTGQNVYGTYIFATNGNKTWFGIGRYGVSSLLKVSDNSSGNIALLVTSQTFRNALEYQTSWKSVDERYYLMLGSYSTSSKGVYYAYLIDTLRETLWNSSLNGLLTISDSSLGCTGVGEDIVTRDLYMTFGRWVNATSTANSEMKDTAAIMYQRSVLKETDMSKWIKVQ